MKSRLRSAILLCVLMAACSKNSLTKLPLASPSATEAKIPTATSMPSLLPTPTSMPNAVASTVVPAEGQPSSACKSTTYCPQTGCRKDECLFTSPASPDYPVGIATVRGYYAQVKRTAFSETKLCDSFVIVGGSQVLVNSYLSLIESGNSVNSKNELSQPIISLDLSAVDAQDKQKIFASNQDSTIEMLLLSPIPPGRGVPVCYSPVEIIKVN